MVNLKQIISKEKLTSEIAIIGYIAVIKFLLQLIAIQGYGYFRDEFYYIACSDNLDFGYVDHPPLAMLLLRIVRILFGESLLAIRLLPALGGFFFVFLTGLIARQLGAKRFAVAISSIAALAPIGNFFIHHFYSMNFIDHIFWLLIIHTLIKLLKTDNHKLWLHFGVLAGLGLMNKISVLSLGLAIAAGIILTEQRKALKSKYIWIGFGIAMLLFAPYIIWNMTHDWASLEFIRAATTYKMASVTPLEFLFGQILYNNPLTLPLWIAGLWYYFIHQNGKRFRVLGWIFVVLFILFTIQQAKDYYLSGIYPVLFAGGAMQLQTWWSERKCWWLKPMFAALIIIPTIILSPMALPVLPVETFTKYSNAIGLSGVEGERHEIGQLPQHYADQFGWKEMVEKVANTYLNLPPEEKEKCVIYGDNYGVAGAISFLGKKYNLPKAYSGHNNYFYWPPEQENIEIAIIVTRSGNDILDYFEEVTAVEKTYCKYAMPYENNKTIFICRNAKAPSKTIWQTIRFFI